MGHAPLRALKWLLISVLILLIITVVTVEVMSWNFLKPIIEDRVESATGRPLNIQGDIAVSLLPRPEFAIGKMSLANADWSAASDMLEVDRVGVRPDLSRLFRGEFALSEVNIEAPVLNLESRANKPGNWSLQGSQDSSPSETEQEPGLPIRIRELNVKDASVRYTAASAESPEMLSVPSLKLRDDRESLRLNTTLAYRDRNFELAANADSLSALMSDPETFEGKASLTSSESRAEASFAFPDLPSLDQLHADWQVTLNDVSTWAQWLRMPKVDLETIKLAATLDRDGSQWQLNNIQAIVVESRINGELSLALGGESPTLTGQLQSPEFDADAVMAALPEGPEQREIAVPALPDFEGKIAFSVGQLNFQQRHFGNVQAQMTLAQQTAAVESFSFTIAQGQVQGTASLTSDADTVGAQAQISLRDLRLAELDLALAPGDTLSGDLAAGLEPIPRSLRLTPETLLANLKTDRVELSYQNEKTGNDLDADLRLSGQSSSPELSVNGEYQHKPVTLTIEGDPLPDLITRTQEYRLKGQANSGQLTAWFNTSVASVLNPETLTADLLVDGANSRDLENWLGAELPALPGFRLAAQVNREDATWSVTGIEGNIGVTDLSGALYFQNTEHPVIRSDLNAGRIDLGQFVADMAQSDPDSSNKASPENGEASPLAVLSGFDGQLDLNASALVLPDGLEFTELVIEANLEAANMQINSLQFGVAGGAVTGNLGLDASSSPAFGHIDTEFESILLSQLGETFTPLEDRLGSLSGALHVEITETLAAARRDELLWPFIGRIHFEPSRFVFVDAEAQTDMTLNLATHGLNEDSRSFRIDGDGQYDGSPFSLQLNGDPLLDARDPNRPYAVDMEADIVDSQISLQGSVLRPFALE
ncbi:MAG: AsmA family protein, partial [Oleiphilaceae bacterium]|nr:AsmA family protein [Oleiphilaceae bacterium]